MVITHNIIPKHYYIEDIKVKTNLWDNVTIQTRWYHEFHYARCTDMQVGLKLLDTIYMVTLEYILVFSRGIEAFLTCNFTQSFFSSNILEELAVYSKKEESNIVVFSSVNDMVIARRWLEYIMWNKLLK